MSKRRGRSSEGEDAECYEMRIRRVRREPRTSDGYEPIVQETTRGPVEMRYYAAPRATRAAVFVGGAGGGFDTPVRGWLYPRLCEQLRDDGIAGLRVRYRHANDLEECVLDVLAGISFLDADGVTSVAVVGHSFGGAVVIQAAALPPAVRTCVALSTQTYGADPAAELGPRCSLLLAHGLADEVLPPEDGAPHDQRDQRDLPIGGKSITPPAAGGPHRATETTERRAQTGGAQRAQ